MTSGPERSTAELRIHAGSPAPRRDPRTGDFGRQDDGGGSRALLALVAAVGLFVVYLVLGAVGSPRAGSGADVGGKLAELEVAVESDRCGLDVGYWAERWDPEAAHHQLVNTERRGDRYQQGTSLVFQCAALPGRSLFGALGALLLPALGGVAAAAGAARITRQLSSNVARAWMTFVVVGLTSPAAFYALDFWEHAPAAGLGVWVISLLLDDPLPRRGLLIGVLAGLAVAFRAELALYLAVAGMCLVLISPLRNRWLRTPLALVAGILGAVAVAVANQLVERAALDGETARSARAGALAAQAGSDAGQRLNDAAVTALGLFADDQWLAVAIGVIAVVGVAALAALAAGVRHRALVPLAALGISLFVARMLREPGFIPGALAAAPLAVAAVVLRRPLPPQAKLVAITATGGAVGVWLLSWSGRLVAQWGGRYLLMTSVLLVALAVSSAELDLRSPAGIGLSALTIAVGVYGMVWHVQRTSVVEDFAEVAHSFSQDTVFVALDDNLAREVGGWYGQRRWLRAAGDAEDATGIVQDSGASAMVLVAASDEPLDPPLLDDWTYVRTVTSPWFGGQRVLFLEFTQRS